MSIEWLQWPAPDNIRACFSTRLEGSSLPPYDSFNVGDHVGDDSHAVAGNRRHLQQLTHVSGITWLCQIHGTAVVNVPLTDDNNNEYDACTTHQTGHACCVMTADCLPVFFCNQQGSQVAVAHAGWRGLWAGVLQNTAATFANTADIIAYLGPAISQSAFEVGDDVRDAYILQDSTFAEFFIPAVRQGHWQADLYGIARYTLAREGVTAIYGGQYCTYSDSERFFSYRRDGVTGRMANLIWMESSLRP